MEGLAGVLTAFGLSGSAGLNAYLPLLVVALMARFTPLIQLRDPWTALTSWWTIGVLAVQLLAQGVDIAHIHHGRHLLHVGMGALGLHDQCVDPGYQ